MHKQQNPEPRHTSLQTEPLPAALGTIWGHEVPLWGMEAFWRGEGGRDWMPAGEESPLRLRDTDHSTSSGEDTGRNLTQTTQTASDIPGPPGRR